MADPPPPARPSRPAVSSKRPSSGATGRPIRPPTGRAAEPVIAETTLVAPPPPPPPSTPTPRRPSVFGGQAWRRTLLPPALVTGLGCLTLGVAYFLQPADAALRQVAPMLAVASVAVGGVLVAAAAAVSLSLRR